MFSNFANLTVEKVSVNQIFDGCQDSGMLMSDHMPNELKIAKKEILPIGFVPKQNISSSPKKEKETSAIEIK